MNRQVVLSCICIAFGYLMFGTYAFSLRIPFNFPIELYWLSFVLVSIPLFYEVIFYKSTSRLRLFYLLSFSLIINLQYAVIDFSPLMSSSDAVADYRLTDKIISDSQWLPANPVEWFFGNEYRFYPVTNFIYATLSLSTGISLIYIVKYLFVVKAIIIPPLIDRTFGRFFDRRLAYLATIIFLSSPGAILFPHKESFAIIFFCVGLYAITRIEESKYLVIGLFATIALIMTHHFTTYVFLGILTSLYIAHYFFKGQKTIRVSAQYFVFSWVLFIAWVGFIAWTIFSQHQEIALNLFSRSLLPGEFAVSELLPSSVLYEKIIVYVGYAITLVSASLGFIIYIRNKKNRSLDFMAIALLFLPILVLATFFRFSALQSATLISHRAYEFGYILIGAVSALFFVHLIMKMHASKKLTKSLFLICPLVLLMLVGPMAGAMNPQNLTPISNVLDYNGLSLNTWISKFGDNDGYIVVDRTMQIMLSGYGDSRTIRSIESFFDQKFTFPEDALYVATYKYMTEYYGTNLTKFENSPYLSSVYTNGIVTIYEIRNQSLYSQN